MPLHLINSADYWNDRFETDWEAEGGPQQTRFFCRLGAENLPAWLRHAIRTEQWSLCDWGCALGDGTDLLHHLLRPASSVGIDISEQAVARARERYPNLDFQERDLVREPLEKPVNLVFTSNTIEHLAEPWTVLERVAASASHAVVVLMPANEFERHPEHLTTFTPANVPLHLRPDFVLVGARLFDTSKMEGTLWSGQQFLLTYLRLEEVGRRGLSLADLPACSEAEVPGLVAGTWMLPIAALRTELEKERAFSAELGQSFEQERAATAALRPELEKERAFSAELGQSFEQERAATAALRAELEKERASSAELGQSIEQERAAAAALRAELDQERSKHASFIAKLRDLQTSLALSEQALLLIHLGITSRTWRIAKLLQFLNSEFFTRRSQGYGRAIQSLYRRALKRQPLRQTDLFQQCAELVDSSRSQLSQYIQEINHTPSPVSISVEFGHTVALSNLFEPPRDSGVEANVSASFQGLSLGIKSLVSIILPVYNQADLLSEAIEGVLSQSYTHWELIIINDGSKDDFDAAVQPYRSDSRIRIFTQPNQKLPSALNNGNAYARGEYLTWTSADNVMLPEQIAVLLHALKANPQAGLAYSDYEAIDDRGEPLSEPEWRRHNRPDASSTVRLPKAVTLANFHESGDNFLGASFLWRADLQAIVGRYDDNTFGGEDYDMWLRMNLITEFVHVPQVLYKYRVHDNTLNAKAKDLGLYKNVRLVLDTDKDRRNQLLYKNNLFPSKYEYLRDDSQYREDVLFNYDIIRYFEFASNQDFSSDAESDRVRIIFVDAPLRVLNLNLLCRADILVVPDELVFFWLKRQLLPASIRILAGYPANIMPAIIHAVALCSFDKRLERCEYSLAPSKPPARPLLPSHHGGVLLLVQQWAHGGMEQVVLELATGLARKGMPTTIGVVSGQAEDDLLAIAKKNLFSVVSFQADTEMLLSYIKRHGIDLVNYHHCTFGIDELTDLGVKTVYTFHNSYIWLSAWERTAYRKKLDPVDAFVAVSREVASYAKEHLGIDPRRCFVIPNGSDLEGPVANAFIGNDLELPNPRRDGQFGYLAVATFNRHKLQDHLIEAFARVSQEALDARLTLVGSPADKQFYHELLAMQKELGLSNLVHIIPGLHRMRVLELMQSHHCFVLPSLVEGFSIALLEAILSGMPSVISDVGGARDLAELSRAVVLVPPIAGEVQHLDTKRMWAATENKSPAFVKNLSSAMLRVRGSYQSMAQSAQEATSQAQDRYSLERMIDNYSSCFDNVRMT
jgi:glycosyltransferase involved in cell wall biosynthesis